MKVSEFRSLLNSLELLLTASGGKSVATEFRRISDSLAVVDALSIQQFADFLQQAEHYVRTGELPTKAAKAARPKKSLDAAKVKEALEQLESLYSNVAAPDMTHVKIEATVTQFKSFLQAELIELAKGFGLALPAKTTKAKILQAISQKLLSKRESHVRTQF